MKLSKKPNNAPLSREEELALIDELLSRSVAEILPSKEALKEALLSGKSLKIYIGTDPTGTSLHLGHATNYMVLERFRRLGHKVIFLIGDFTARIGDPTDKDAARKQLSREDVKRNVKTWLKQVAPIINLKDRKNPVIIKYNHDWLSKLDFEDIIGLASNFTVQQMLERDMFEKRLAEEKPIYLHEFFYPLMQGYDSVAMDVDIELCGNDQKFNALAGRTLQRKINNKEKFVFITTLLVNPVTGEKMMSKSQGTGVFLDSSAKDMFGGIMAQADENIPQLFTDCTYVSTDEIKKIGSGLKSGELNPRDIKARLAKEIVAIYHGWEEAERAAEEFDSVFKNKEIPDDVKEILVPSHSITVLDALYSSQYDSGLSKGDARRLIEQGAIEVDGEKITDPKKVINISEEGVIIKIGKKRKFIRIKESKY
jgi:tyrosyl-tRNA synthetase